MNKIGESSNIAEEEEISTGGPQDTRMGATMEGRVIPTIPKHLTAWKPAYSSTSALEVERRYVQTAGEQLLLLDSGRDMLSPFPTDINGPHLQACIFLVAGLIFGFFLVNNVLPNCKGSSEFACDYAVVSPGHPPHTSGVADRSPPHASWAALVPTPLPPSPPPRAPQGAWVFNAIVCLLMSVIRVWKRRVVWVAPVLAPAAMALVWTLDALAYLPDFVSGEAVPVRQGADHSGGLGLAQAMLLMTIGSMSPAFCVSAAAPNRPLWVAVTAALASLKLALLALALEAEGFQGSDLLLSVPVALFGCLAAVAIFRPEWTFAYLGPESVRRKANRAVSQGPGAGKARPGAGKASVGPTDDSTDPGVSSATTEKGASSARRSRAKVPGGKALLVLARRLKRLSLLFMVSTGFCVSVPVSSCEHPLLQPLILVLFTATFATVRASTLAHEAVHQSMLLRANLGSGEPVPGTKGREGKPDVPNVPKSPRAMVRPKTPRIMAQPSAPRIVFGGPLASVSRSSHSSPSPSRERRRSSRGSILPEQHIL